MVQIDAIEKDDSFPFPQEKRRNPRKQAQPAAPSPVLRRYCPRLSALHSTPYTLHLTLYTLHPKPYILHPTLYTLHPTPYTLHPTPYTLYMIPVVVAGRQPPRQAALKVREMSEVTSVPR